MNQIAVGDPTAGFTVVEGQSIAPPFKHAASFFTFSPDPWVTERLEIHLAGTPSQISAGITGLETSILRAQDYRRAAYPSPQYLRFQPVSGGEYFYTPFSNAYLESNPAGYKTHQAGSRLVTLHYTRASWFDGQQIELPLTGRSGPDVTGGFDIFNHTDHHTGHISSLRIKPEYAISELPAPLRIELQSTYAPTNIKDIHIGSYYHPTNTDDNMFFGQSHNMTGGTQNYNINAIGDYYRRLTWSSTAWSPILYYSLNATQTSLLDGRSYQPIILLYNTHTYDDLYLQLRLKRGVDTLYTGDPIFIDPDYKYILFPPIEIPPNQLLREVLPHFVELVFYARKVSGASYTLDVDQVMLLPLDYSASFLGFFPMRENNILVDDSHRQLTNVRYSHIGSETVAHVRTGSPLMLTPNVHTRLFFLMTNTANQIEMMRTATVKVFYRQRKRFI